MEAIKKSINESHDDEEDDDDVDHDSTFALSDAEILAILLYINVD